MSLHSELLRLADLVRGLQQLDPSATGTVLDELTGSAVRTVAGAQYGGVTVARGKQEVESACAKGRFPVILDGIQSRHREGPCLSAASEEHRVLVDDLARDGRWPQYRSDALKQTPIRSIVSYRLSKERGISAALNLFADHTAAFDHEAVELGQIFASLAAMTWTMLRRDN